MGNVFSRAGITVQGNRWYDLWYEVRADCWAGDGYFCGMPVCPTCCCMGKLYDVVTTTPV